MIAHLNALVHRYRNHPCVIRWSQCNEPEGDSTNSSAFQQQLYQTVVAADDTRPVSADPSGSGPTIINAYGVTAANFTVFEHYSSGFGTYTHDVAVSTTHPYGVGEFIWPADNSAQGLMWFATSTVTLRQKDPSDIRPYTLLSAWASFVPGMKSQIADIIDMRSRTVSFASPVRSGSSTPMFHGGLPVGRRSRRGCRRS